MPEIKLHADKYEQMIARRGRRVKWREAVICSCWNMDSGQPAYECQACNGLGYVYEDPIEDLSLIMSVAYNKEFEEMAGVFEVGDAIMTVPRRVPGINPTSGQVDMTMNTSHNNPLFDIGMNDLITLTDDVYKSSEILQKGVPMYGRPADTLINEDVVRVKSVRKNNSTTGDKTDYTEGVHYTLNGNKIDWIVGAEQPMEGEQYSVVYEHRPMFTVFTNLPTPRYQDKQELPKKVVLRYRAGGFDKR